MYEHIKHFNMYYRRLLAQTCSIILSSESLLYSTISTTLLALPVAHTLIIFPRLTSLLLSTKLKGSAISHSSLFFFFHSVHISSPSSRPFNPSPLRYIALKKTLADAQTSLTSVRIPLFFTS